MATHRIVRGRAKDFVLGVLDADGARLTAATTPFLSTDALAFVVRRGDGLPVLATVAASWTDSDAFEVSVPFLAADTATLPPGVYRWELTVTRDARTGTLDRGDFEVLGAEGPGSADPVTATTPGVASTAPDALAVVYCTDEDLLIRAPQDFLALCPKSQVLAEGADGQFAAASPWTLLSGTCDFSGLGVASNGVVALTRPPAVFAQPGGLLMAVNSVGTRAALLRRPGKGVSVGQPPAPSAGLTGVSFRVPTFGPQIDVASRAANRFFGVDPSDAFLAPAKLYDVTELRDFTAMTVLRSAYLAAMTDKAGDFALKFDDVTRELEDLRARLVLRWADDRPPTTPFGTRCRR